MARNDSRDVAVAALHRLYTRRSGIEAGEADEVVPVTHARTATRALARAHVPRTFFSPSLRWSMVTSLRWTSRHYAPCYGHMLSR